LKKSDATRIDSANYVGLPDLEEPYIYVDNDDFAAALKRRIENIT
jgi:nitrogen fixation protein